MIASPITALGGGASWGELAKFAEHSEAALTHLRRSALVNSACRCSSREYTGPALILGQNAGWALGIFSGESSARA